MFQVTHNADPRDGGARTTPGGATLDSPAHRARSRVYLQTAVYCDLAHKSMERQPVLCRQYVVDHWFGKVCILYFWLIVFTDASQINGMLTHRVGDV